MLRSLTVSLMFCRRAQQLPRMHCSSIRQVENTSAVDALYNLSVDISKIRKLKGWVLYQSPVYVMETVAMLRNLGARDTLIAQVLEHHPEAILCPPEHLEAQKELWMSICASHSHLVGIIEKFPASFFTSSCHIDHQRANVTFFQNVGLNKRVIAKLMASAPQNFTRPVEQNEEMVQALQKTYLELGGSEVNMKVWLQKLLSQNPYVLMKSPETMRNNFNFLHKQGFTSSELLQLLSRLKGFVTELHPESMGLSLSYSQETLACSDAELRQIVLQCPALLYYSVPILTDRFKCLLGAGISLQQIMQTPTVLELTTQIVQYRIQKLRSYGHDIKTGSLELLNGTKKDFEMNCGKLLLRRERPLFNPVAPLRTDE
ncbi:transcription termination factor 2, mitochondrial [Pangasianodon hypophthalmus]|uniref:transcription termination factor 2, mitochondrial n=1 Tax=Pangasianodon hypophthalmus TaxID=310915 RepID=UPI000F0095B6|nr:transcription termination factor 2, mitochondrial [Pangasianodon hypophthalmus]